MNKTFKKWALIWFGVGLILTSVLYVNQISYNSKYTFIAIPKGITTDDGFYKSILDKRNTYYQVVGAVTVGGALVILAFGLKEKL